MFAMLNGRWPRTTTDGLDITALEAVADSGDADARLKLQPSIDALVADAVRAQEAAGLDLVTDGQVRWPDPGAAVLRAMQRGDTGARGLLTRTWRSAAALTERTVAQVVPGPYSLGRRVTEDQDLAARSEFTLELAGRLAGELQALAAAGCAMVVVEEPAAIAIGADDAERELFAAAQLRLLAGAPGLHTMLVIQGGSAWEAGAETILSAPYRSYLFDLIAGPDNWYLVRAAPGDRGIVCGALDPSAPGDQGPVMDWAARYAASANGRGSDRVGLANASSLAGLAPAAAGRAMEVLARAARLGALPLADAVAEGLDPRVLARSPRPGHRRRRTG